MDIYIPTSDNDIFIETINDDNFTIIDELTTDFNITIGKTTKNKFVKSKLSYSNTFDNLFIEDAFPDIIEYWDGDFPYKTFKCSSNQLVFLKCNNNHKWQRTIQDHVKNGYFTCKVCFFLTYPNLINKYTYWGESVCAYVLKKLDIKFKYQSKLDGWSFDFFVNGKFIEFDGAYHFNIKYLDAIDNLYVIENDILKTNLCIQNNIPLLRISYKEILNVEYWITKFLNSDVSVMYSNPHLYQSFP